MTEHKNFIQEISTQSHAWTFSPSPTSLSFIHWQWSVESSQFPVEGHSHQGSDCTRQDQDSHSNAQSQRGTSVPTISLRGHSHCSTHTVVTQTAQHCLRSKYKSNASKVNLPESEVKAVKTNTFGVTGCPLQMLTYLQGL